MIGARRFASAAAQVTASTLASAPAGAATAFVPPQATSPKITTLPNGIRVISQDTTSALSTVGVFLLAGSKFESVGENGLAKALSLSLLRGNEAGRSSLQTTRLIESLGGEVVSSSFRDTVQLVAQSSQETSIAYAGLLTSAITGPTLADEEISTNPANPALSGTEQIVEKAFSVAFGRSGLGNNPNGFTNPESFSGSQLRSYFGRIANPKGLVVSATNVNHEKLAESVKSNVANGFSSRPQFAGEVKTKYVGGESHDFTPSSTSHIAIAFLAPSATSTDQYTSAVFSTLLGGGLSFSEGGPGKGMHTHLYRKVLCLDPHAESAQANYHPHSESGLFVLQCSSSGNQSGALVANLAREAAGFAGKAPDGELLSIGKNLLCTRVAQKFDTGLAETNALSELYGTKEGLKEIVERIQGVTGEQVKEFARRLFSGEITYVSQGDVRDLPSLDALKRIFRGN